MAPHSRTLAWKIPWMEEPGGLQSMGSKRVGHDWVTSLSLFTFTHCRRKWQPTPLFLPGESQGWGNLVGCHLLGHTEWSDLAAAASLLAPQLTLEAPLLILWILRHLWAICGNLQGNTRLPILTLDSLRYTNPEEMKTVRALTGPFRRIPNYLKSSDFPFCISTNRDKSLSEKASSCWIMLLK